ncbi:hypothetical protein JIX56_20170 [Streptomyces sp. CA-210063]|uniref:hypothetical protein n=1 Tax=Streptomyces sp. CA-210063 TaxID=2801029 RepID=UPI00214AE710|nr:hypothetical protein [Streptomyces sp. CA-210063]UUU32037.1 hypothetical protein JIX56_20170 [Streptomyces sp. CA-210063]
MGNNAEIRRVDREIVTATAKLEAVKRGEWWPLTGSEKRKVLGALAGGSRSVVRGNSPSRAESKLDRLSQQIETRLETELSALRTVRETLVREDAKAKAKNVAAGKKSSSWW